MEALVKFQNLSKRIACIIEVEGSMRKRCQNGEVKTGSYNEQGMVQGKEE